MISHSPRGSQPNDEGSSPPDAVPQSLLQFMARVVDAASPPDTDYTQLVPEILKIARYEFTPERASLTVLDAFLRTAVGNKTRDFRLLELILPPLKGTFKDIEVLPRGEVYVLPEDRSASTHTIAKSDQSSFEPYSDACSYLMQRASRRALLSTFLVQHTCNSGPGGIVCAIPLTVMTTIFTRLGISREHRPTFPEIFQLRALFSLGVLNLQDCPGVFCEVQEFLNEQGVKREPES